MPAHLRLQYFIASTCFMAWLANLPSLHHLEMLVLGPYIVIDLAFESYHVSRNLRHVVL